MSTSKVQFFAVLFAFVTIGAVAAAAQTEKSARAGSLNDALGVYNGPFGPNTMTMRIEKIEGKTASGYSEVGKNRRTFSGSVEVRDNVPEFELREPGDDSQDGVFRCRFEREQQALVGTWTPNNTKLVPVKFTLTKSGKSAKTRETIATGEAGDKSTASGYTDGTISRYDNPLGATLVVKDAKGVEHTFAARKGETSVMSYLYSESFVGTRIRVHWEAGVDPDTGEKVKFALVVSEFGGGLYLPAKGSEREAIIAALAADYQRRYKKRTTFDGTVRVDNGWAGFSGTAKDPGDKGPGAIWVAILRGSDTKWKVVGTSAGDETTQGRGKENDRPHWDEYDRLRKQYPDAPVSIIGLLDYP